MLHLFFAAVAALDCVIALLRAHPKVYAALRCGIKDTWSNLFSRMLDVLYDVPGTLLPIVFG